MSSHIPQPLERDIAAIPVNTTNNAVDPHALLHPLFAVAPIFLNNHHKLDAHCAELISPRQVAFNSYRDFSCAQRVVAIPGHQFSQNPPLHSHTRGAYSRHVLEARTRDAMAPKSPARRDKARPSRGGRASTGSRGGRASTGERRDPGKRRTFT
jgi:hypothetical protein